MRINIRGGIAWSKIIEISGSKQHGLRFRIGSDRQWLSRAIISLTIFTGTVPDNMMAIRMNLISAIDKEQELLELLEGGEVFIFKK